MRTLKELKDEFWYLGKMLSVEGDNINTEKNRERFDLNVKKEFFNMA